MNEYLEQTGREAKKMCIRDRYTPEEMQIKGHICGIFFE